MHRPVLMLAACAYAFLGTGATRRARGAEAVASAETAAPSSEPPHERTVFYGYQNMAVSYAGLGIFSTGRLSFSASSFLGAAVFLAGSPIVHGLHGDDGRRIAGSLLLNLALPFLGGLIASSSGSDTPGCQQVNGGCLYDGLDRTRTGVIIGMAIAPLLDGLILGWKTEKVAETGKVALTPALSIAQTGDARTGSVRSVTTIGVRGVF